MPSKLLRTGLFAAALAVVPTALVAQDAAPAPVASAQTEIQQIQARLTALQARAGQDAEVQAASAAIITAMETADAEFKTLAARALTIRADVDAARAATDNAKLNALAAEATALQASLATARARASTNADVQAKIAAHRTVLLKKMVELDPETQKVLARLQELRTSAQ